MKILNQSITNKVKRPIKVMQFGEGNFLRGFVDYMIDIANQKGFFDGDVVLVKPIERGNLDLILEQECQYTVILRGLIEGEKTVEQRVVTCIQDAVDPYTSYEKYLEYARLPSLEYIVSNTTEAGIVFDAQDSFAAQPARSYPEKLTQLLYERFSVFAGDQSKGLVILPVELIDNNGQALEECVFKLIDLWNLGTSFRAWVKTACVFASTLVDRIVTGYPTEETEDLWKQMGYKDRLIVTGEPFALWVIESKTPINKGLPLDKAGLPVIFTADQSPYKKRKVRILNGAHTSFVLAAFLAGHDYVLDAMEDPVFDGFVKDLLAQEVIPTLDLPKAELVSFADSIIDRFNNPFIKHALLAISLNSVSKWRARCMPSFLGYIDLKKENPPHLIFSLAALIAFYKVVKVQGDNYWGQRGADFYPIQDDLSVLTFFATYSEKPVEDLVEATLQNIDFWGSDLTLLSGVQEEVTVLVKSIFHQGVIGAMQ